ncbi:hypothetical protein BMS3Abin11_01275 [bacterium BMS3Abin11]|nr:hypothetical protein BMS3Abin11_01275 [bacterium BMS3Abin11]
MDDSFNESQSRSLGRRLLKMLDISIRALAVIMILVAGLVWGFILLFSLYLIKKDVGADVDVTGLISASIIGIVMAIVVISSAFMRASLHKWPSKFQNFSGVLVRLPAYVFIPISFFYIFPHIFGYFI